MVKRSKQKLLVALISCALGVSGYLAYWYYYYRQPKQSSPPISVAETELQTYLEEATEWQVFVDDEVLGISLEYPLDWLAHYFGNDPGKTLPNFYSPHGCYERNERCAQFQFYRDPIDSDFESLREEFYFYGDIFIFSERATIIDGEPAYRIVYLATAYEPDDLVLEIVKILHNGYVYTASYHEQQKDRSILKPKDWELHYVFDHALKTLRFTTTSVGMVLDNWVGVVSCVLLVDCLPIVRY